MRKFDVGRGLLSRPVWVGLVAALLLASSPAVAPASAQTPLPPAPNGCSVFTLPHGALGMICVPATWNGELVIWAHGYVDFTQPLGFYHLEFGDGTELPAIVQSLGFAFATTSYRQNGLAVLEGVEDIRELALAFRARVRVPNRTYLVGASEGGLITALALERHPELFSGGLSACGPIGDFRQQVNYIGDFRVLFDYFFPGVIPGNPTRIPAQVIANWSSVYEDRIRAAMVANPRAAYELMATARAPYDPADFNTVVQTALDVLWYNAFGTNDIRTKLGGNPYDNRARWYSGSSNDIALNLAVQRFTAQDRALSALRQYETSGVLTRPLVTLHTTADPVIPFWHQVLYFDKTRRTGSNDFTAIPIWRYGHCEFEVSEALAAFLLLALQVAADPSTAATRQPAVEQTRQDFLRARQEALPRIRRD